MIVVRYLQTIKFSREMLLEPPSSLMALTLYLKLVTNIHEHAWPLLL
jgi:hypothetical protein